MFRGQGIPLEKRRGQAAAGVSTSEARTGFFKKRGGLLCQGHAARVGKMLQDSFNSNDVSAPLGFDQ